MLPPPLDSETGWTGELRSNTNLLNTNLLTKQGSIKSKIGWELTKNGCHVRSPGLSKAIFVYFSNLLSPLLWFLCIFFWVFRQIWLAISISDSSFLLLETYFWSYFSWLAQKWLPNLKLARNTFPPFPSFWSPVAKRIAFYY